MRLPALLVLLAAASLAGCATAPQSRDPANAPSASIFDPPPAAIDAVVEPPLPKPFVPEIMAAPIAKVVPPPFRSDVAADLEQLPVPADDLWDRIVKGYAVPDIEGPLVEKWERWYSERPEYVARMVDRSRRYLYHIVNEVDQRGLPLDVALLPMIESAFNPRALSTSRAAGIWQFIPSTGKHYGLEQNFWFDSRRDVVAATDKALDYLQKLFGDFGDWQLALAAYNWGEGNVGRALERNRGRGLPVTYEALAMPDETRNYLPKLQAVKNIVRDPEKYGLVLADIPDAPYFTAVKVSRKMDVKRAAELAELPEDEFLALNPQHNRPVMAGADAFTILLPIDKAELFAAKLDLHDQPLVSWQAYRMKPGETLQQVAARVGMSVETLRAVNGIGARARLHGGHLLLVPAERGRTDAADASLQRAVFTAVPQGRTFFHTVRRGETLTSVAARYGVGVDDLRSWNGLTQSAIRVGQQIRVTSDVVTTSSPRGRSRTAVATGGARPLQSNAKARGDKPPAPAKAAPPTAGATGSKGKGEASTRTAAPASARAASRDRADAVPAATRPARGTKPAAAGTSIPSR
ncbi:MAG TPA: transglycosylase SLT domain-containing protein [Casimicrobiaceae bacterium]|nr:transglycosylase SLT domain-containing protein [Casimicrobiaceae bacterium]